LDRPNDTVAVEEEERGSGGSGARWWSRRRDTVARASPRRWEVVAAMMI
jgi:hypothetical protein